MPGFKINIPVVLSAVCLLGCAKEYSYERGDNPAPGNNGAEEIKSEWRFTEDKNKFFGPVDTAYLTKEGTQTVLTLSGKAASGNQFIEVKLKTTDATIQKGKTYKTSSYEIKFLYKTIHDTLYAAIPLRGGDLSVTISDISPSKIIATFKGLVLDKAGRSLFLTDGYFSSPIKKGPESNKGYVMLWAKEGCNGPIKVKVNNIAGEISRFSYSAPDCGDPGMAVYNLPSGTYSWAAYCGTDSITGTTVVQPGSCTKLFVEFPFIPSPNTTTNEQKTCKISELLYSGNLANASKSPFNNVIADYTGPTVQNLQYYVAPAPRILDHPVTYVGDTVFLDADTQFEQYFIVDARKRVIEYRGFLNPTIFYPVQSTLIRYTYNNQNELIKRAVLDPRYLYLKLETSYQWVNGNITSTIHKNPFNGGDSTLVEYEYHKKEVRSFPFTDFDAFELVFFQPLLNFGKSCKNPPRKKIFHGINDKVVYSYDSYIIDANNYVLSCRMSDGQRSTDFSFRYRCF